MGVPSIYTLYEITNLAKQLLDKYPDDAEEISIQGHIIYLYTQINEKSIYTSSIEEFTNFNREILHLSENKTDYLNYSFEKLNELCESYHKMIDNSRFINYNSCRWKINLERFKHLKRFYISNLYLSDIINIPQSLVYLISINTFLKKIGDLPSGLKHLVCRNNILEKLPNLQHTSLELLSFSTNMISIIPNLPNTLKSLTFNNNNVTTIPNLPKNLQRLECSMNKIRILNDLPYNLVILICSHNYITKLPCLSSLHFLNYINCKSNNITEIPPLPGLIEYLDYSDNPIEIFVPFPSSLIA